MTYLEIFPSSKRYKFIYRKRKRESPFKITVIHIRKTNFKFRSTNKAKLSKQNIRMKTSSCFHLVDIGLNPGTCYVLSLCLKNVKDIIQRSIIAACVQKLSAAAAINVATNQVLQLMWMKLPPHKPFDACNPCSFLLKQIALLLFHMQCTVR